MASSLLIDWWNERAESLEERIRSSDDSKDTEFHWGQLVWQELRMWERLGARVDDSEMDFIVNRRGFTTIQRAFLVEGLTFLGLYGPGLTRVALLRHEGEEL